MELDPDHPIIAKPWEYAIGEFHYHAGLDGTEPYIDLFLQRGSETRRLRFRSPRDLEIEPGFPRPTHGMRILDVRGRQLDGIGVWVMDVEGSWGAVTFWAHSVVDRDAVPAG